MIDSLSDVRTIGRAHRPQAAVLFQAPEQRDQFAVIAECSNARSWGDPGSENHLIGSDRRATAVNPMTVAARKLELHMVVGITLSALGGRVLLPALPFAVYALPVFSGFAAAFWAFDPAPVRLAQ